MKHKIGLGIVSYKRFDYLKQCLTAAKEHNYGGANYVVVVEDDDNGYTEEQLQELEQLLPETAVYITKPNGGVATAKNTAINHLWDKCEHFFLMEDDILMNDDRVCEKYIYYANLCGLKHLNFALHGEMNKGKKFIYHGITCYPDCVGAFSYYHKDCFLKVGLLDSNFKNAWEHVFHTLLLSEAKLTTPFWKFADHPDSDNLLKEIPESIENSSIRPRDDWQENIRKGREYALKTYGRWLPPR